METNNSLEVSALVWFDELEDSWMYSVFIIHDDEDEELNAWGSSDTKSDAAESVKREIQDYFSKG